MKRLIVLLAALLLALMLTAASAEGDATPLLRLYCAERALLFGTSNVTMTGHAVFTADGAVFKTADLMHIQDGSHSVREWLLLTPTPAGDTRETGYVVVALDDYVYAYESYHHAHKQYYAAPDYQRISILRNTVAGDTLTWLAELVLGECGSVGECAAGADGETVIMVHLAGEDISPVLHPLLSSILQYGISRYTGYDYAGDPSMRDVSWEYFNTTSEGLAVCLRAVVLRELDVKAVLDAEGRIRSVTGMVSLDYEGKSGGRMTSLRLDFEQQAFNYGTSQVNDDPLSYDRWPVTGNEAQEPPMPLLGQEAARQLLHGLYWDPRAGGLLHADSNCPTVSTDFTPMGRADITPDLLLENSLCPFCVNATPFPDMNGDPSLDAAAGALLATLTYDEFRGLNELARDLYTKYGPFRTWSFAQKHCFTRMLPALALMEEERVARYHPGSTANIRLWDTLCVWSYGLPADGEDGDAMEAAVACALAEGLLTREQLATFTVTCDYRTGSSFVLPFPAPWWVIRFSDRDEPMVELWLDSSLTSIHAANLPRMETTAHAALTAYGPKLNGEPVAPDTLDTFARHVVWDAETGRWLYVFDSDTGSNWIVIMENDPDLTVVRVEASNG